MSYQIDYHAQVVEQDLYREWPRSSILAHFRSLRIGDYRVVYTVFKSNVTILAVGHRRDMYQWTAKRLSVS